MLPNLRIIICGVVFGPLLFAVTGAGVLLPDSNTRVGEMPEVSRPMMQRVIAEEPAQAQFRLLTLARRNEELERLRERAALEVAPVFTPAQPDLDSVGPTIIENPVSDDVPATGVAAPVPQPPGVTGIESGTAPDSLEVHQTDVAPDETDPVQVTALPPADTGRTEHAPSLTNVPLPPHRPGIGRRVIHSHGFSLKHPVAQASPPPPDTFGQLLFSRPLFSPR